MAFECLCCYLFDQNVTKTYNISKYIYLIGFTLTAILTWVLRDNSGEWFVEHIGAFDYCSGPTAAACGGKMIAIRISFANFVFFGFHALALLWCTREEDPRVGFHTSCWIPKFLAWGGIIVGFFFIPSGAAVVYSQVARFGSGLFLIFQMIDLINFFYIVNEWLVAKDSRFSWIVLVGGSVLSIAGGVAFIGASYAYYAPHASCSLNIFFITWSLILVMVMIAVLFVPNRTATAGLLTSGSAILYCNWLLFSALNSEPPSSCVVGIGTGAGWITVVGFFIAIFVVAFSTMTTGASSDMFGNHSNEPGVLPYRADFFHFIFALASMYLAMLFTNWDISADTTAYSLGTGWISTWVKIASKWFCELAYIWTVVAPAIFPNRDFGYK